jgi:alkylation response protein AidB-like acyl-CoA dehydrogenase
LSGHKSVVLDAPGADRLIVTARIEDGSGKGQLSFFLVDRTSPGLTIKEYFTIDGRPAGDVVLDKVTVLGADRISMSADGLVVLERVLDEAALAACWESVGAMERLNELSLEWCKERVAFGQPLSKLQVVQHRLVDMHVAIEHAAAITTSASQRLDGSTLNRAMLVSAAKATVAREGLMIGEAAVQLHGAAGTTEDLDVSRYFKRILTNNMLFGNRDHHVQRYLDIYFANQEAPA